MCDITMKTAKRKAQPGEVDAWKESLADGTVTDKEKEDAEKVCKEFVNTKEYNDKETLGYGVCCEVFDLCGMSGWTIFLIIIIVLLILAGAGAAFWFFYLKRKLGGKEKNQEKGSEEIVDSEESSTKSDEIQISVNTTY